MHAPPFSQIAASFESPSSWSWQRKILLHLSPPNAIDPGVFLIVQSQVKPPGPSMQVPALHFLFPLEIPSHVLARAVGEGVGLRVVGDMVGGVEGSDDGSGVGDIVGGAVGSSVGIGVPHPLGSCGHIIGQSNELVP